jgi:hypothetical protein
MQRCPIKIGGIAIAPSWRLAVYLELRTWRHGLGRMLFLWVLQAKSICGSFPCVHIWYAFSL